MGKKYIVEYDRDGCIGAAACVAVDSKNWVLANDGKADLMDSKKDEKNNFYVREIDESELSKWLEAAQVCPVLVIHIIDPETGKRIN